jgi:hypothetical protein
MVSGGGMSLFVPTGGLGAVDWVAHRARVSISDLPSANAQCLVATELSANPATTRDLHTRHRALLSPLVSDPQVAMAASRPQIHVLAHWNSAVDMGEAKVRPGSPCESSVAREPHEILRRRTLGARVRPRAPQGLHALRAPRRRKPARISRSPCQQTAGPTSAHSPPLTSPPLRSLTASAPSPPIAGDRQRADEHHFPRARHGKSPCPGACGATRRTDLRAHTGLETLTKLQPAC